MFEEYFLPGSNNSTDGEDKNPKIVPRKPPNDVTYEVSQDEFDFVHGVGLQNNIEEFDIWIHNAENKESINIWAKILFKKYLFNYYCFWHFIGYDILQNIS